MASPGSNTYDVVFQTDKNGDFSGYRLISGCNSRTAPPKNPEDITLSIARYLPFDNSSIGHVPGR